METTSCVSTTVSVNCHKRWCSLRWSLIVRAAQAEAEMSGWMWSWRRAWWNTNWKTSEWEGKIDWRTYVILLLCLQIRALTFMFSCLPFCFILFQARMDFVYRHLERTRQVQTALRAFEARDRYLLEDNLWRVSFWSCLNLLVMLAVAVTQIYTLRRLFDDTRRVCT